MHYYIIKYRLEEHGGFRHRRIRADSVFTAALRLMSSLSIKEKDIREVVYERHVSG